METKPIEKKSRERGAVYLAPNFWKWLRHRKADTRRPIGEIIERALTVHIETEQIDPPSP